MGERKSGSKANKPSPAHELKTPPALAYLFFQREVFFACLSPFIWAQIVLR